MYLFTVQVVLEFDLDSAVLLIATVIYFDQVDEPNCVSEAFELEFDF